MPTTKELDAVLKHANALARWNKCNSPTGHGVHFCMIDDVNELSNCQHDGCWSIYDTQRDVQTAHYPSLSSILCDYATDQLVWIED